MNIIDVTRSLLRPATELSGASALVRFARRFHSLALTALALATVPLVTYAQCATQPASWVWNYNNDGLYGFATTASQACQVFQGLVSGNSVLSAIITSTAVTPGSAETPSSSTSLAGCYFSIWYSALLGANGQIIQQASGPWPHAEAISLIPVQGGMIPCPQFWVVATPPPGSQVCSANCVGDPINPATGGVYATETDVQFVGPSSPIAFQRYFSSADNTGDDGVAGWRHSYGRSISTIDQYPVSNYLTASSTVSPQYSTPDQACTSGFAAIQASVSAWTTATATFSNGVCVLANGSTTIGTLPIQSNPPAAASSTPLEYDVIRDDGQIIRFTTQNGVPTSQPGVSLRLAITGSGFTVTDDQDDVEVYNGSGVLQSITSRSNVVQTMSYDSGGNLNGITDSFGNSLTIARNTLGSIASVAVNGGANVQYAYDGAGRLIQVTNLDSTTQQYSYGNTLFPNALTAKINENSATYTTWTYDAQERATSTQQANGVNAHALTYNSDGTVTDTDALGAVRIFTFTREGDVDRVTAISGSQCPSCQDSAATTYDTAGYVSSRTDYNGNLTCYANDPVRGVELVRVEGFAPGSTCPSNLSSYTPATGTVQRKFATVWDANFLEPDSITQAGRVTTFTYDTSGDVLTRMATDTTVTPNVSRTWTYTYNSYGQVLTAHGPRSDVSATTTFSYYACATGSQCGQIQTVTDALGHVSTFNTYNVYGQPLSITDPNGVTTTLTYDARERPISRQVAGETTSFSYYATGLRQKVTLPDASFVQYGYDAAHRLTAITDSLGNNVQITLDALGNRTAEKAYDLPGTLHRMHTQVYNTLSQLYQDIDSAGTGAVTTIIGYDAEGNATTVNAPLERNSTYAYDPLNRRTQVTDPAGGVANVGYDANNNVVSIIDPLTLTTGYNFDGFNEVTQRSSPDTGASTYTYDAAGNLSGTLDARGAQVAYSYDALDRVTQMVAQNSGVTDQTLAFGYDAGTNGKGRLTSASDNQQALSWTYDALGRVTVKVQTVGTVPLPTGYGYTNADLTSQTTPSGQAITYAYNANHQIIGITVNGNSILTGVTYDPFGPVNGWQWGNGTTTTRSYSLDGRATQITSAGTSTYTYNDDGTISSRTDDTARNYNVMPGTASVTAASGTNQIASTTGTLVRTYAYDGAGNTTGNGSATFGYDDGNRLTAVTLGSNTTTYILNALGQRVSKTVGGGTTLFAYDESGRLIGEYDGGGHLIEETVWLGDVPVATLRPDPAGGVDIYYVHSDHLNTPRRVTRPSDNAIVWAWTSDPFGNGFVDQNPDGDGQYFVYNLRFPGQYYDAETGLNYNYFRDYDPAVGRYIESDPIGLTGGINTYAYASGNPVSRIDPLGLWDWPSLPQSVVNASAGLGDALLLNQGQRLRNLLNINGGVDSCSASYHGGQLAGIIGGFVSGEGEAEIVEGAFSAITDVTAAGARVTNIATDVTAGDAAANLLANGYEVVQQTVGPNGPVTVLSNGVNTYNIYTATSTGASSMQVINAAGQTLVKIRLGGP